MRTTAIRLKTHIGMQFKAHWLVQRKKNVAITPAELLLLSQGIKVFEPKEVIRPSLAEEPYVPVEEENIICEEKPPCYVFNNFFVPLALLDQGQHLTNSVVFNTFPDFILNKVESHSNETEDFLKDILLQSHVLDATQKKLPLELDVVNHPGYHPPRTYGIPKLKKISSLVHHLCLDLQQKSNQERKFMIENAACSVTLNHYDRLMHLHNLSEMVLCSKKPLEPVFNTDEVKSLEGTPLPDLYPFSPFIHSKLVTDYDSTEGIGIPAAILAPHTVFMPHETYPARVKPEVFMSKSLLYAFAFAAAYAKEKNKDLKGDLERPVTLNIVHTNGQLIHVGRFQLNTLDCSSPVKNLFWHEPLENLFEKVGFDCAKPLIEKVNTKPYRLLKALC